MFIKFNFVTGGREIKYSTLILYLLLRVHDGSVHSKLNNRHIIAQTAFLLLFSFCCFLALPLANWSTFIDNTTTTSIQFSWQNLSPLLGQQISHYFVVLKNGYGYRSSLNGNIMSGNTTSHVLSGLSGYTEYRLSVVGVDVNGTAYNSTEVTVWTDEGGTYFINIIKT